MASVETANVEMFHHKSAGKKERTSQNEHLQFNKVSGMAIWNFL
jgi:hypothetical protein